MRGWPPILILLLSIAGGIAVAVPGGDPPPAVQRLRWMGHWKGEGLREQLVLEVLDEFRFLHPEIEVQFAFAADVLPERSQAAAAEGIVRMVRTGQIDWDVVWLDPLVYRMVAGTLGDWEWGRKHLVDFNDVPGFAATHKPLLTEGPDAHRHTGGVFPGPYIEGYCYAAWYNRAVAERVGIVVREEGMAAKDLLDYVRAVDAYNRTAAEPVAAFVDHYRSGATGRLAWSLLCSECPECGTHAPASAAAIERVAALFAELARCRPFGGFSDRTSKPDAARALLDGRALFLFDATWRYNELARLDPVKLHQLGLAQMPGFDGPSMAIGGYMTTWAVMKNAPGREAGIHLLEFWSRPCIAERWVRYTKCPAGLRGDLYDPGFGDDIFASYQGRLARTCNCLLPDPLVFASSWGDETGAVDRERIARLDRVLHGEETLSDEAWEMRTVGR